MADPRMVDVNLRQSNHSPLMARLVRKQAGQIINFCPFGCQVERGDLDENGYCAHLIGFYNGGRFFEPRVLRKRDKRIIVDGSKKLPMKKGYRLVKITTSARVYSPEAVKDLVPANSHQVDLAENAESERKLLEFAEQIRHPVLDGEWEDSIYEDGALSGSALAAAASETKS